MTSSIIHTIGYYGPLILIGITAYVLLFRRKYLIAFFVGLAANQYINETLKTTIKQSRPSNSKEHFVGPHIYGMPSSHAQTAFYALVYLFLTTRTSTAFSLYSLTHAIYWLSLIAIALTTLYQRYADRCHTMEQLAAGSIAGSAIAYLTFHVTQNYIQ